MKKRKRREWALDERQLMHVMLSKGKGFREIGEMLDRDWRVVKRAARRYDPQNPIVARHQTPLERGRWDHDEHRQRLRSKKRRIRLKTLERQNYVVSRLDKASPEIIAGRYMKDHPGEKMSAESIYQFIYVARPDLKCKLEIVSKRGNRKRSSSRQYRFREPAAPKRSISERVAQANNRAVVGHMERDSVMGKQSTGACVQNICDRKSRLVFLSKLHACTAEAAKAATYRRLHVLPPEIRLTMTQDNGSENALHAEEEKQLNMRQHFCHPYSAWERGSVEKLNRSVIRRFFPKGTDFSKVNFQQIAAAETYHNNRPMKCLSFKTPLEVFTAALNKFQLTPAQVGLQHVPW